jgi:hypothetical protein
MIVSGTKLCLSDISGDDPIIPEWFNFNGVIFDFIQEVIGAPDLDVLDSKAGNEKCVVLIKMQKMISILTSLKDKDKNYADNFFGNKMFIIHRRMETLLDISNHFETLKELDKIFSNYKPNIHVISDGFPDEKFKGIKMFKWIFSHHPGVFISAKNHYIEATHHDRSPRHDYLCLAIMRDDRPHRKVLFKKLDAINLIKNGHINFHGGKFEDLQESIGDIHLKNLSWSEGVPSISLYNKINFEIVCETFSGFDHDSFCLTEKTLKPISMKMPFVLVGTKDFLKHLRSLGFKTFNDLIDESYDSLPTLDERVSKACEQVSSIIGNGSEKFYNDARSICEHNYENLGRLSADYRASFWRCMKEKVYPNLFQ